MYREIRAQVFRCYTSYYRRFTYKWILETKKLTKTIKVKGDPERVVKTDFEK